MSDRDIRYTPGGIEIRSDVRKGDGTIGTIRGYSAVFDSPSEDLGGFREFIAPGAFTRTLADGADVRGLLNHDSNLILGRTASGTMRMGEDKRGLWYEIDVPDTQTGRDTLVSIKRGDVSGSSFAFLAKDDKWETVDGEQQRTLLDVDLYDSGPVTTPAYPATVAAASMRSLEAVIHPNLVKCEAIIAAWLAKKL